MEAKQNELRKEEVITLAGSMEPKKKKKIEKPFCVNEKGGLEKFLRLAIDSMHKLYRNDWAACDFEKNS